MADSDPRRVRSFRNHPVRTILAAAALGTMVVASVAVGADSAAAPRTLATRGPVIALAADGERVGLVVRSSSGDPDRPCTGVVVWEPMRRRVVRLQRPRCDRTDHGTQGVALAGTRVAWLNADGGNTLETFVVTATLARPSPLTVAWIFSDSGGQSGTFAREPVGDGTLLAFTVDRLCDPDGEVNGRPQDQCPPGRKLSYVLEATVWRIAGRGRCPVSSVRRCSRVAQENGELSVLAVDAGRIAVRTESGLRLLTAGGAVLQEFDLRARAAALSGNRLAVRTADAIEVYDTGTGQRTARFAAARQLRLEDLDRDILVTALGRTVTLRRLGNGRTTTIRAGGTARAQLERPGLFVAGGRRVTFTPMRDVLRRLGE